ncbi:PREDICTED: WD repeat-containing protein 36-like, partial [Mesitornis unicolor]|uniref:WD repeat-containing protein 36-like n=1 Tax=Mesitornis unicolor TaxID=54374 RepID=UPI0005288BFC
MYVHKRYLFLKDVDVAGDEETCDEMIKHVSPEQLGEQLLTLSSLPESRWKNLLSLDVIKKKNKPKEPPKVPKSAPFFIPTIPGLIPQYIAPEEEKDTQSKLVNLGVLARKSDFCIHLEDALSTNEYTAPLSLLKSLGPSNIERELRGLAPEGGGSMEVMLSFLRMIEMMLNKKYNFELSQAYLALFLKSPIAICPVRSLPPRPPPQIHSKRRETYPELLYCTLSTDSVPGTGKAVQRNGGSPTSLWATHPPGQPGRPNPGKHRSGAP